MSSITRASVAEFVGSFGVVLIAAGSVLVARDGRLDLTGVALAYGLASATMTVAVAPISGGVLNPAVAGALWVSGRLDSIRAVIYVAAQLAGAVAASLLLRFATAPALFEATSGGGPTLVSSIPWGRAVVIEATATFLLSFAVLSTLDGDRPSWKPAAITGAMVAAAVLAFFPVSGAALNPARWFGPALVAGAWTSGWVWVFGPLAGGALAGLVHGVGRRGERVVP